ncbi:MAG: homoserine dehydrogenase [Blastomonas sp.]
MTAQPRRYNVAIAGYGGVGKAVAEMLLERRERYRAIYNADIRLIAVCGSKAGLQSLDGLEPAALVGTPLAAGLTGEAFLRASPIDILVEAGPTDFRTGGPGLAYIRDALSQRRHVIAISKGALVVAGAELRELAGGAGVHLKVSGATAAALPTLDLLTFNLLGSEVVQIEGILNGTSNYLLTEMVDHDVSFEDALSRARQAGIAESDPSFDVEGWDTACKLLIIANFGLGANLALAELTVCGINGVTRDQLAEWRKVGKVPRLIGYLGRSGPRWTGGVELRALSADDPLSLVRGKNKAIRILTREMGEILAAGGASDTRATAGAALKDLEHILAGTLHL